LNLEKLIISLKEVDKNLEEENPEFNDFKTKFGKEFEINFEDVMNFINIVTVFPIVTKAYSEVSINFTPENYLNFLHEIIEEAENKSLIGNPDDHQKLVQLKSLISEMQPLLLESGNKNNENEENNTKNDDTISTMSLSQFFSELHILERITSYFILTLFTYIDMYSMAIFKHIISNLDTNVVFDFIRGFKVAINPLKRIEGMFKNINFDNEENLRLFHEKLVKKASWESYLKESYGFIETRNYIAHRDPLTAIGSLKKNFPKSAKIAKTKTEEMRKTMIIDEIPLETLKPLIEPLLGADYESIFLLQSIGFSCYRYLISVDLLINQWTEERKIEVIIDS